MRPQPRSRRFSRHITLYQLWEGTHGGDGGRIRSLAGKEAAHPSYPLIIMLVMAKQGRSSNRDGRMLVNKLSIEDARHTLKIEGGELTPAGIATQFVSIALVLGMTARAIWIGEATAWHLTLPMIAEYLTLLVAIPLIYLFLRHPAMRKDAIGSVRMLVMLAIVLTGLVGYQAYRSHADWGGVLGANVQRVYDWIVNAQMHWAILAAVARMAAAMLGRVRNLYLHGPPFVGVSLGCAMRFVVLFFGVFLLPVIAANWSTVTGHGVWIIWGVILLGDVLALWMRWDIQRRLRKVDAGDSPNRERP
jgi:hypothetical protein